MSRFCFVLRPKMQQLEISQVNNSFSSSDSIAAFLETLTLTRVKRIIKSVLSNRADLEKIADRSYSHPNGFDKIPLVVPSHEEFKVRLHIWWPLEPGQSPSKEDIHDHRWDFCSKIITGQLALENWSELSGLDNNHRAVTREEYRYHPRGNNEYFSMEHIGCCRLIKTFTSSMHKGSSYSIAYDQLHRATSPSNLLTSTVMIQQAALKTSTRVMVDTPLRKKQRVKSPRFSPEELRARLERYLDLVSISNRGKRKNV